MKTKCHTTHRDYLEAANDLLSLGQALAREDRGEVVLVLPTGEELRYHTRAEARTARSLMGGYFYLDQGFIERSVRRAFHDYEIESVEEL